MLKELFEAVRKSAEAKKIEVDGKEYITNNIYLPPREPLANPVRVYTLSSFVDYINQKDSEYPNNCMIVVNTYFSVSLLGPPEGRQRDRSSYVVADCTDIVGNPFEFERFHPLDKFLVELQSKFEDDSNRAKILKSLGTMKSERVAVSEDDGVSTRVTCSQGISMLGEGTLPSEIELVPYRTFPEVQQPASKMVLRVKSREKEGASPQCSLYVSDGGSWKLEAMNSIKEYLAANIKEEIPILA